MDSGSYSLKGGLKHRGMHLDDVVRSHREKMAAFERPRREVLE